MEDESRGISTQTKVVKVQIDKETAIFVEARVVPGEGEVSGRMQRFEQVAGAIEKVTGMLTKAWEKAGPSRASVELNLEFAWEAGELLAMFVQGSTSTSLKIKLEWEKPGQ